ncbi:MAG: hypothetical protein LBU86_03445 [Oscillospiraceae bacterium]|nr:hypothetical protein [Oscillospiraceae bacterium]
MNNGKHSIENLLRVDFGEIDGYGDPNLTRYFLDNDYWNKIVRDRIFYVVGKKGTGKSSIYRMIAEQGTRRGVIVENKDFGDFPFEKLLNLSDDSFAMPNQYQSVWKNLILSIFACMIAKCSVSSNSHHEEISRYVEQCLGDVVELHKEIINYTTKINGGLAFGGVHASRESEKSMNIGSANGKLPKSILGSSN